ncbi:MAG TPA: TfoX/Sxy family protein [Acetobacteraceae bacterium]|nr:TfoX/Sxy family protein [Acetobacteraceae bacterium]
MPARTRKAGGFGERPGDEFAAFVAEMFASLGAVQVGRLFSGHGFKLDGVQFAMILRGVLYLRADAELAAELSALGAEPFAYRTKLRTVTVGSYYAVPEDRLDEAETVLEWARRAVAAARANAARTKPGGGRRPRKTKL